MTWEDKIEMVKLLNNEKYKEAVEMFGKEQDWDEQAVQMFVIGFDLTQCEFLEPIKERITTVKTNDWRTAVRLAFIEQKLNGTENKEG